MRVTRGNSLLSFHLQSYLIYLDFSTFSWFSASFFILPWFTFPLFLAYQWR
nr:MAG TPA: hypothetical protein [Caudoviricetes sp.]